MVTIGIQFGGNGFKSAATAASGAPCGNDLAGDATGGGFGVGALFVGGGGLGISIRNGGTLVTIGGGVGFNKMSFKRVGGGATVMDGWSEITKSNCPNGKCC